jgi:hypothetical protein
MKSERPRSRRPARKSTTSSRTPPMRSCRRWASQPSCGSGGVRPSVFTGFGQGAAYPETPSPRRPGGPGCAGPLEAPPAYVDRHGQAHLSGLTALRWARAFAAVEAEAVALYLEQIEHELLADGLTWRPFRTRVPAPAARHTPWSGTGLRSLSEIYFAPEFTVCKGWYNRPLESLTELVPP